MKKFKSLLLCSTILLTLGMFTACGKVPEITEDDVIDALVDEKVITKEQKKEGDYKVKIDEVELNDDEDRATVECSFTIKNGSINKTTEYKIKFKLDEDDKEWEVRKGKIEAGDVKSELAEEISDDKVKELIGWESFSAEDQYISFSDSTTTYEIKKHNLDKEAMTDVVTVEGTAEEGYLNVSFTVEYTFSYSGSWYASKEEVVESSSKFVDGYEMTELSTEDFAGMLADEGETFWVMGYRYDTESENVTISDVKLGEVEYNGSYNEAEVTFTVKEKDVEFTLDSKASFSFDTEEKKWNFNYFNETVLASFKCDVIGTWSGTNDTDKVVITINDTLNEDGQYLSASITITTQEGVTGTYDAYVYEYNPDKLELSVEDDEWTLEPSDSSISKESFYGNLDEAKTNFKGRYTWNKWSFTKQQ